MKTDFHFHSTFSDGSETVDHIFQMANEFGVRAVALTDHDTVLGIPAAREASRKYQIPFIPAAEFTAEERGIRLHVLGYRIDDAAPELLNYSRELLDYMMERSKKQIKLMQQNGIAIAAEEFLRNSGGGPLYRAKLLRVLAEHGYIELDRIMALLPSYFSKGAAYYVEDRFPYRSLATICDMIKRNGGLAVLAHPEKIKTKSESLYYDLIRRSCLDGLEVYHPSNSPEVRAELLAIADGNGLICTGGTDFHGFYMKQRIPLGSEKIPDEVYERLKTYLENP
jgi:predicted metal-dependent phosphoesterase TrpH